MRALLCGLFIATGISSASAAPGGRGHVFEAHRGGVSAVRGLLADPASRARGMAAAAGVVGAPLLLPTLLRLARAGDARAAGTAHRISQGASSADFGNLELNPDVIQPVAKGFWRLAIAPGTSLSVRLPSLGAALELARHLPSAPPLALILARTEEEIREAALWWAPARWTAENRDLLQAIYEHDASLRVAAVALCFLRDVPPSPRRDAVVEIANCPGDN